MDNFVILNVNAKLRTRTCIALRRFKGAEFGTFKGKGRSARCWLSTIYMNDRSKSLFFWVFIRRIRFVGCQLIIRKNRVMQLPDMLIKMTP